MTLPVRAFIFDLDGTLVETEQLKARAYADVIGRLLEKGRPEEGAVELYKSIVGSTDQAVCHRMIEHFGLLPLLDVREGEEPWQALHRLRMERYRETHGTPANLRAAQYAHNVKLAKRAKAEERRVAVATMSFSDEAERVIGALGLSETVDSVVGVNHVQNPKPAPDAFLLAMERLGVSPSETLIIEDSPAGTRAAMRSGARWICVATPFSIGAVRQAEDIERQWVVEDPSMLAATVARRISASA
jgi:HAD superfamily hydrolase (TIGR01509 family)